MVTVVCTRWLDAFPAAYVRLLRNAVRKNLSREHRFICVTDNLKGLDSDIEGVEMPDMGLPLKHRKKGCWPKLSIFAPGVLPENEATLYLDLDMLIRDNIDSFFERIEQYRGFHALREWNPSIWNAVPLYMRPDRGVQGSILGFFPCEQHYIYEEFMKDPDAAIKESDLDQGFISKVAKKRKYWPFEWTVSFKKHCVRNYPFNQLLPPRPEPKQAKIVVFHGTPRPIELVPLGNNRWGNSRRFGFGPVSWVRDYWLAHDESWQDSEVSSTEEAVAAKVSGLTESKGFAASKGFTEAKEGL